MDAPEKIYIRENSDGPEDYCLTNRAVPSRIEYIRADLYEQLQQENVEHIEAKSELEYLVRQYGDEIDQLKAQLQQRVPDGWKLVPMEPTVAMRMPWKDMRGYSWYDKYKAMINAAPQPPEPGQSLAEIKAMTVYEAAEKFIKDYHDTPGGSLTPSEVFEWMFDHSYEIYDDSAPQEQREGGEQ